MTTIIFMFGFGMVTSYIVSILEEKVLLEKEMKNLDIEEVSDNSDFTKPLVFDENTVNQETIEDNADETEEEISNETLDDDKSEEIELL